MVDLIITVRGEGEEGVESSLFALVCLQYYMLSFNSSFKNDFSDIYLDSFITIFN